MLGLSCGRPVGAPGLTKTAVEGDGNKLSEDAARRYRSAVGKLLYLASSRFGIQYAVRDLCCALREPTQGDERKLRHLAKYLREDTVFLEFPQNNNNNSGYGNRAGHGMDAETASTIKVYVDSDWAGATDRKSISAGAIVVDGCLLHHWSRAQTVVAQSSCEAELIALNEGANEGLGIKSLFSFIGYKDTLVLYSDSSAARSVAVRLGPGSRLRHIEVRYLHLQDQLEKGMLRIASVPGSENPADIGTKAVNAKILSRLMPLLGLRRASPAAARMACTSNSTVGGHTGIITAILNMLALLTRANGEDWEDRSVTTHEGRAIARPNERFVDGQIILGVLLVLILMLCLTCMCCVCSSRIRCGRRVCPVRTRDQGTQTNLAEPVPAAVYITPYGDCFHVQPNCKAFNVARHAPQRRRACTICVGRVA